MKITIRLGIISVSFEGSLDDLIQVLKGILEVIPFQ